MAALRVSVWLFAFAMLLGCGRTAAPRGVADDNDDGMIAGSSGTSPPAGSGSGGAATGGATTAGAATGGTSSKPVDPSLEPPSLRLPQNGHATGSVWFERSQRPRFVWDAEPTFTSELQVDDSCETGKLQSCEFSSPEYAADLDQGEIILKEPLPVSEVAPVGRRYYWRVRSCTASACSPWSSVRYVDVGRQKSDFDGDGFADVVLNDPGNIARQGRVLVGFGPAVSSRTVVFQDAVAPETPDHFGQVAKTLGDLDADGFADLLVTAPGDQQALPGIAYVYFGSATFSDSSSHERLLIEPSAGDRLAGAAAAAGDVDADGRQDFVLDSFPSGPILYRGAARNVSATALAVIQSGKWLQQSSAGDVTGDGYSDLVLVSLSNDGTSTARYDLLHGSPMGFAGPSLLTEKADYPVATCTVAGDVNRDGFSDLGSTVNHPGDAASNRIDVTWGAASLPLGDPAITWAAELSGQYADIDGAIPAGDVNGDGYEDSLASIAWHTSDVVQANLYLGGQGTRATPDASYAFSTGLLLFISQAIVSAPGDLDGDGYDDVMVAEGYGGTARIYFGSADLDENDNDGITFPPP